MPSLKSPLGMLECVRVLKEQVAAPSIFRRGNTFRAPTSGVAGVIEEDRFWLKSTRDAFSMRFIATLKAESDGTVIHYVWRKTPFSALFGSSVFDESEVLEFLRTWLRVEPLDATTPNY